MRQTTIKPDLLGSGLVITAGVFWGSLGIFARALSAYGFTSLQIACLRLTVGMLAFAVLHFAREKDARFIKARDIPLFLGLGIGSILFFSVCYFTAISLMPLSTAAILLYTSPIWVMLMSCVFFRERLTARKVIALCCAFGGCTLVSGISGGGISMAGLLYGLGSGIGYGLYSILGSVALKKYSPLTVTCFTFIFAALGAWILCSPADMLLKITSAGSPPRLCALILLIGLITAVVPFLCYTCGLQYVKPSKASILATIEPVVATLLGAAVFNEPVDFHAAVGIALILASVVLLNVRT